MSRIVVPPELDDVDAMVFLRQAVLKDRELLTAAQ
jgi:hypothetical protein